jgi:hypothetical protein
VAAGPRTRSCSTEAAGAGLGDDHWATFGPTPGMVSSRSNLMLPWPAGPNDDRIQLGQCLLDHFNLRNIDRASWALWALK